MENWEFATAGSLLAGLGATLIMDIVALVQNRLFGTVSLDYALVGRWVGHMPAGRFRHPQIAAAAPVRGERPLGWAVHYATGAGIALLLTLIAGPGWLSAPRPLPVILFGTASVLLPWLVLQPAFGLGLAAARTPSPGIARLRSLRTHTVFGIGLWLSAAALSRLL
ncbi:MAG: DUF2938 domain-containing protein [Pseudodonghicola sp.]